MDLVTVVYGDEINLLRTQAQSINLYASDIDRICVVINDDGDHDIDPAWWGKYHDRVVITRYTDYSIPAIGSGWDRQQICKLMAAKTSARWSLVLDAKTWFIKSFDQSMFIDDHDMIFVGYRQVPKVFQNGWAWLCSFFEIGYVDRVIGPGGVPFVMDSSVLDELEDTLLGKTGQTLVEFFCEHMMHPTHITEFGLYSAFIWYRGYHDRYRDTEKFQCINLASGDEARFQEFFQEIQDPLTLTVSIHRKAQQSISDSQLELWKTWLAARELNMYT